jgi:hypothetical protein
MPLLYGPLLSMTRVLYAGLHDETDHALENTEAEEAEPE